MSSEKMFLCWNFSLIIVVFVCHSGLFVDTVLVAPPAEFPTDNSTYIVYPVASRNISDTPPHVFPDNDPNYKVIKNISIVNDLMTQSNQNCSKVDTEVPSLVVPALVHKTADASAQNSTSTKSSVAISQRTNNQKPVNGDPSSEIDPDLDHEDIDENLSKTEDVRKNASISADSRSKVHQEHDHKVRGSGPILQGQLAAILAGAFALLAVASYVCLLTWRRYLEHRYGNRELLINEEDNGSYNDMKNFEL